MHIRKSLWLLLLALLSVNGLQAERVFILFDATCMDRLEYKQLGQPGSYVVYQVNVAPGERLLLEVGQESGEYRGNLPTPLIGCSTGIFDAQMAENINRGLDEVFLINRLPNGRHTVTQVSLAATYQFNQQALAFDSPKYQFRFDLQNGEIGENIATPGTQKEVFFEGRMEEQCLGAYIFRQFAPRSAKPHMDLVFIPQIGFTEERAGFTLDEALTNAIKLDNINGIALEYKIQQLCNQGGATAGTNLRLSPYGSEVTPPTTNVFGQPADMSVKGEDMPVTNVEAAPPVVSQAQEHNIVKGETLYSIAKKYGVSVKQLKDWNNLKSNTIYKGRQLKVSDGITATTSTMNAATRTNIASSNPGSSTPVPYGANGQRIGVTTKGVSPTHIVRTGETVASIAMKYGYTEARFREMNGLKSNEYPKIGQALKTSNCDCPEVQVNSSGLTPRAVNPYEPQAVPPPVRNEAVVPKSPVNNFSYSAPTAYDNAGQPTTTNRPFTNYSDTPVPATSTRTAPTSYSTGANTITNFNSGANSSSNTNNYNSNYNPRAAAYDQVPAEYSTYNSSGSNNLSNSSSYNTNDFQAIGKKKSHVVKDGEDLFAIARRYGTTVQRLRQLNRMDANEVVIPNQKIYLE